MMYLWLLIGFFCLVKGADLFVDGSAAIAKILNVPTVIIGLTIVAFGTSAPEAAVSIMASLSGNNDIAISNVIGSNMFNSMVVIGVCGAILPMKIQQGIIRKEMPFSILITILLVICMMFTGKSGSLGISRMEGLILLFLFVLFVGVQIKAALGTRIIRTEEENIGKKLTLPMSIVYSVAGLVMIIVGGKLVVDSASQIAAAFGMSQTLIGLTIVAIGTSLPELVTSVVAAAKGENDLAMGNVVGSNIFNILLIVGMSASISPLAISPEAIYDGIILLVMSVLLYFMARRDGRISRGEAISLLVLYGGYTAHIIMR